MLKINKKFYLIGVAIVLTSFIFAFSASSVLAAGCEKNQKNFSFSKFLNPFAFFIEKVANNFGYNISLAAAPDPDVCGWDTVGCSGTAPTATIGWEPITFFSGFSYYTVTVCHGSICNAYNMSSWGPTPSLNLDSLIGNTPYDWSVEAYAHSIFGGYYPSTTYGYTNQPHGSFTTPNCATVGPSIDNVTINSPTVVADNSMKYVIRVYGSSSRGAFHVSALYGLINFQGPNAGAYRGYLTWTVGDWFPGYQDHRACNGGGYAAVQPGFGNTYIHLDSCSLASSGGTDGSPGTLIASFLVRFDPSFTTPTTNNNMSGYVIDDLSQTAGWTNFPGFDLASLPPGDFTLNLGSGSATCNSVPLSWTDSSGADGYRVLKGSARVNIATTTALNLTDYDVVQHATYKYQIEAYNGGGTKRSNSIDVTTPYCPPTVDIKANESDGPISISYNTSATVSWSSTNATSCSVSPSGWTGTSGSQSTGNLTSSRTYTLNCTGPGGPASDSVTINVSLWGWPDWKEIIPR